MLERALEVVAQKMGMPQKLDRAMTLLERLVVAQERVAEATEQMLEEQRRTNRLMQGHDD